MIRTRKSKTASAMKRVRESRPSSPSLAKLTAPTLPIVLERERLFRELDAGRNRPLIWIAAPPGMGKTTLAASYIKARRLHCLWYEVDTGDHDAATLFHYLGLAAHKIAPRHPKPLPHLGPEYALGLETFTRRFFQELYRRLPVPCFMVFDNVHEISPDAFLYGALPLAAGLLPKGVNILVLSRIAPPPILAQADMAILDGDLLRLTANESDIIVRKHAAQKRWKPSKEMLDQAYAKTQGWVAGLILILEQAANNQLSSDLFSQSTRQPIFDFLAGEVLQRLPADVQDALCKIAFMPSITAPMAEELTRLNSIGRILARLYQEHYFTESRFEDQPQYQFHPLFREFLLNRARTSWSDSQLKQVRERAAQLLEKDARIEDAITLLMDAGQWGEVSRLILMNAGSLMGQGRSQLLLSWLNRLSPDLLEKTPWLMFWMGAAGLTANLAEGRSYLEKAFTLFEQRGDSTGVLSSWAGIVESMIFTWDNSQVLSEWIQRLEGFLKTNPTWPSPDLEARVTALMMCALLHVPQHPTLASWSERAWTVARSNADVRQRQLIYHHLAYSYLVVGDWTRLLEALEAMRKTLGNAESDPVPHLLCMVAESDYAWTRAEAPLCERLAVKGLALAEKTGVHILDNRFWGAHVMEGLVSGDLVKAETSLEKIRERLPYSILFDRWLYGFMATWIAFLKDDYSTARGHAEESARLGERGAVPFAVTLDHLCLAQVYQELGDMQQAQDQLEKAHAVNRQIKSDLTQFMILVVQAYFHFQNKSEKAGFAALREAITSGQRRDFVNFHLWRPRVMAELCVKALEHDIEVEYVKSVVRRRGLMPKPPPLTVENWPWPIKIFTMGRFEILNDGASIKYSRKTQRRPLELLKLMIARGGQHVSQQLLADALWPEAEGDAAEQAFATTLHRLRKLLGSEESIELRGGLVSLNSGACWIDVWAFEALLTQSEKSSDDQDYIGLTTRAVSLYQGTFLPNFTSAEVFRARLKQKYIAATAKLAEDCERRGNTEKAIEQLEASLKIESAAEALYVPLMRALSRLGRRRQALDAYERYRANVLLPLGLAPSREIEELYHAVKN
jgi:LuxR family transcriptional regulator, maltose regulon positive regulatory protein